MTPPASVGAWRAFAVAMAVGVAALLVQACTTSTHQSGASPGARPAATTATTATSATTATTAPGATAVGAGCGQPHARGRSGQSFVFDGERRLYQLFVPASYTGTRRVPVVFEFHGYGSNALQQIYYGNFIGLADRDGFLIVAPDGQGSPRHFNLTGEPGLQDDIAMVEALLSHIEATMCVDTTRVFATGMSDGGAMSAALACTDASTFAAFATVAVVAYQSECVQHSVAIEDFSGTADPIVPFNGGRVTCCGNPNVGRPSDVMAEWAAHDRCGAAPADVRLGSQVERMTWTGCEGTSSVVFYVIDGGGHTWPGALPVPFLGLTTEQINASDLIWAFFQAHPLSPT
jgi:polyhydroxybutyrate depolymerase